MVAVVALDGDGSNSTPLFKQRGRSLCFATSPHRRCRGNTLNNPIACRFCDASARCPLRGCALL